MAWDPVNKTADAIIESSADSGALPNDKFREDGGTKWSQAVSNFSLTGKSYFEWTGFADGSSTLAVYLGVANENWDETDTNFQVGTDSVGADSWAHVVTSTISRKYHANVNVNILSSGVQGDVFQVAFDADNGKVWFGKNNTWTGDPSAETGEAYSGIDGTTFRIAASLYAAPTQGNGIQLFTNDAVQTYDPPTGFSPAEADGAITYTFLPTDGVLAITGSAPELQFPTSIVFPNNQDLLIFGKQPTARLATTTIPIPASSMHALMGKAPEALVGVIARPLPLIGALNISGEAPTTNLAAGPPTPDAASLTISGKVPFVCFDCTFSGDADLPYITASGQLNSGIALSGDVELAPIESSGNVGLAWNITLPAVESTSTMLVGRIFTGIVLLNAVETEGTLTVPGQFSADISLPSIEMGASTLSTGLSFGLNQELAAITLTATLKQQITFSADLDLAAIALDSAVLLTGSLFQGSAISLPALEVDGVYTDATTLTYFSISTNTFNRAHSPYANTDFDGIGRLGTNTYAAMSDGLYKLNGEDDNGVGIEAYFLSGYEDFGVEAVKAQRVAYLGYSADGPMSLLVRTDTDGATLHTYSVESPHQKNAENDIPARIKLGRGLRGRYWQVGLRNCEGADFYIDRVGLGVWTSTRKR